MELYASMLKYVFFIITKQTIGRTDMRPNSILAIGMHGVFILQSETKVNSFLVSELQLIQREIPFDAIPCWGYTKDSIILYVGSFVHQEKLVFGTKEGKEINNLLQHYVTYLTEQLEANGTHSQFVFYVQLIVCFIDLVCVYGGVDCVLDHFFLVLYLFNRITVF